MNIRPTMFQTGDITSLMHGVYEGSMSLKEVAAHGDFGLGTFNRVCGEMLVVDGKFYRIDSKGKASIAKSNSKTPFSAVTFFQPKQKFLVENIEFMSYLESLIDKKLDSKNYIYAIKIEGSFKMMKLRTEEMQPKPYRPFQATIYDLRKVFYLEQTEGTLVATYFPPYLGGVNAPKYHFHYIDKDKKIGGHVLKFQTEKANVFISAPLDLHMTPIDNELFRKRADLSAGQSYHMTPPYY